MKIKVFISACACLLVLFMAGCGKDSAEVDVSENEDAQVDEITTIQRRKIDRLDPKSFIEVTLELKREEKKWRDDWQKFMQLKRDEFFVSFGLSEQQFNDYTINNQREFQQFLRENTQYNQLLMRMQEEDAYQP